MLCRLAAQGWATRTRARALATYTRARVRVRWWGHRKLVSSETTADAMVRTVVEVDDCMVGRSHARCSSDCYVDILRNWSVSMSRCM